ncbi:MAG: 4-alpha-glucanotransferase [Spirochaetae bacterium HGW-Spirochaetae-1]|jgi:4-alpha-glucanotransferase|nr:MAG: 4-alpha-glucanotransferase [Spirochaetae bacterium HGW-Spirochaetae-1]
MDLKRTCGVLLHLTSLPGTRGIGTLGVEAFRFADFLIESGMTYWQILPLGPVSPGMAYSPYASTSTFAGNWHCISLEKLSENKWFGPSLPESACIDGNTIDFEKALEEKTVLLQKASEKFFGNASEKELEDFENFCYYESYWLDDYALFAALADHFGTNNWMEWEPSISRHSPGIIDDYNHSLFRQIRFQKFLQYVFYTQWRELKEYCNNRGIGIIGDIPIYVTLEGADAWAHPELFQLDEESGKPAAVSGVPPDYFSETGQRWGNPLYRWLNRDESLNEITFQWWVKRIKHLTGQVDILRIDHFRGFESYWAIPADEPTAINGKWVPGPGLPFFQGLKKELGDLPLIAEDLGVITPEVEQLRDGFGLPGMKILQFAFDWNSRNSYLPQNIENPHCVLYTGTHDNNTTNGWFYGTEINDTTRAYILDYLDISDYSDMHRHFIKAAYRSTARLVIIPMQDILGYGGEFRMNRPGTVEGNWLWKLTGSCIKPGSAGKLRQIAVMYNRVPAGDTDKNGGENS